MDRARLRRLHAWAIIPPSVLSLVWPPRDHLVSLSEDESRQHPSFPDKPAQSSRQYRATDNVRAPGLLPPDLPPRARCGSQSEIVSVQPDLLRRPAER